MWDCVGIELPPANSCQYQVFWNTSAGCPVALAWGVYFLIFFSVAAVGYFGGGYAYNSRQRGLSGSDAVPHFEFWVRQRPSAQQQLPACLHACLIACLPLIRPDASIASIASIACGLTFWTLPD